MPGSLNDSPPNKPADYRPPMSAEELVRRYNAGERYFWEVDIPERADLRHVTLAGATFNGGWLSDLDFSEANLRDASFLRCNLKCTDFRGADLLGAIFRGSSLEATDFGNTDLSGIDFTGAHVYSYELKPTDGPNDDGSF
jgi:uncharacterized protein YjbI with pentapeptide repeats